MTPGIRVTRAASLVFYSLALATGAAALFGMVLFFYVVNSLPQVPDPLGRIIEIPPTEIFAATGERLMVIGGREVLPLEQISPYFLQAVMATEDHRFNTHHGIDKLRILKSIYIAFFQSKRIQGASTITQQLAKNLFFSFERSYLRKFKEILIALQIESRFSKKDILEAYVNQIAFGVGAFGIEQAAKTFFNKHASELTLAEATLIAGIPKSPTRYNPFRHLKRARHRQKIVLQSMVKAGYLSQKTAAHASKAELKLNPIPVSGRRSSYFADLIMKTVEQRYGPDVLFRGGLKITTTLDSRLQALAQKSVQKGLNNLDHAMGADLTHEEKTPASDRTLQGALVAIECRSGAVKAMVGGRYYHQSEYNRAIQSNRQPGSNFKPFLYYTAFNKLGLNPATVMVDKPVRINVIGGPSWVPKNFSHHYRGPIILKEALLHSVNTIAAQLVQRTGPQEVIRTARECGIQSDLAPVYSVALGTSGVSPLEMASAFSTLASGGVRYEPFWIWRIEDAQGHVLEEKIIERNRVLNPQKTYQLVDMMRGVVDRGTGRIVRKMGFKHPAAGKTGTTNDFKDAWFTGFTPTLSASVWVGYDRSTGMRDKNNRGITGGRGAAPIWANFMIKATENDPQRDFQVPAGIQFVKVNSKTGCTAGDDTGGVSVALTLGETPCGLAGSQPVPDTPSSSEPRTERAHHTSTIKESEIRE